MRKKITALKYLVLVGSLAIMLTGCQLFPKQETSTDVPFYSPTVTPTPTPTISEVSDDNSLETIEAELDQVVIDDPDDQLKSLDSDISQL